MQTLKPKRYVNVYTEANPNPQSLKFVVNFMLVADGESYEFTPQNVEGSPLAAALFQTFPFVEKVFIAANFITLTRNESTEWEEVVRQIKQFVQQYLEEEKPVLAQTASVSSNAIRAGDSPIVQKIKSILDEYVRPAVEQDGGAITFHSFDEASGQVRVLLQGACSGCPSSTITLKAGIENLLKRMVPEVKEVVAEGV